MKKSDIMADGMTKEKWNNMNRKQKIEYFNNYYLKFVIIGVLIIAAIIYTIVSILTPSPIAISGEILNTSIIKEGYEQYLCEDFLAAEGFDKRATAVAQLGVMNHDENDSYQTTMTIDVRMAAKDLDYFITDEEGLEIISDRGMLLDLSVLLDDDMMNEMSDRLVERKYPDDTVDKNYVCAIEITDSEFINTYADKKGKYYIAVAVNSKRTENVVKMIQYLLQ